MTKQSKRHLTREEEFDIMKLVLDKFLLLGVFIMALGLWMIIFATESVAFGFSVLLAGAVLLIVFAMILVKEFNFLQK